MRECREECHNENWKSSWTWWESEKRSSRSQSLKKLIWDEEQREMLLTLFMFFFILIAFVRLLIQQWDSDILSEYLKSTPHVCRVSDTFIVNFYRSINPRQFSYSVATPLEAKHDEKETEIVNVEFWAAHVSWRQTSSHMRIPRSSPIKNIFQSTERHIQNIEQMKVKSDLWVSQHFSYFRRQ